MAAPAAPEGAPAVAVVGAGLIGGSVALAAQDRRAGAPVTVWDPAPEAREGARARGLDAAASLEDAVAAADVVVVCAPVGALRGAVGAALAAAPAHAVVTDVGSVKATVADVDDPRFVAGHPLAGAETAGIAHARASLFEDATWYLTPHERVNGVGFDRLQRFLRALGARPSALDPRAHDELLALVSHLPHVLANVLVAQAVAGGVGQAGPSFRDMTRVAGAPSAIWTDIYRANAGPLTAALDDAITRLGAVRDLLRAGDPAAITTWNDAARRDRRTLAAPGTEEVTELRVSVPNAPGVVAQVALALGAAGVNIADMALSPAPDEATGTITLWIAGPAGPAVDALGPLGFPVDRG